jgi:hypothetical protein
MATPCTNPDRFTTGTPAKLATQHRRPTVVAGRTRVFRTKRSQRAIMQPQSAKAAEGSTSLRGASLVQPLGTRSRRARTRALFASPGCTFAPSRMSTSHSTGTMGILGANLGALRLARLPNVSVTAIPHGSRFGSRQVLRPAHRTRRLLRGPGHGRCRRSGRFLVADAPAAESRLKLS